MNLVVYFPDVANVKSPPVPQRHDDHYSLVLYYYSISKINYLRKSICGLANNHLRYELSQFFDERHHVRSGSLNQFHGL